jgi:hypothetical protein
VQRIKRIITITAITAMTAGSVPAIAAAAPNTGSGSGSGSVTPQQVCGGIRAIHNVLGLAQDKMDKGSAADTVLGAAGDALFNLGDNICAGM